MVYDMNTDYTVQRGKTTGPERKAEYEAAKNEGKAALVGAGANKNIYYPTSNPTQPASSQAAPSGGGSTVTYIDENGNKKTGYIFGGTTYADEAGKTPVGVGSVVTTGDGNQYIKTPDGSMLYSDYLKRNGITETQTIDSQTQKVGTGYLSGGQTYADPLLTQRIADGTIVNTGGGAYIKTADGSMLYSDYLAGLNASKNGVGSDAMQTLTNQLDQVQIALEKALAGNDTVYAAQLQQLKADLQGRIDSLNRSYKDANKQLYIDYMNSRKALPQQLAAQGYTGGLRESSMLGLDTSYQGNLNSNEQARISGITDLENGAASDELELLIAKAQADRESQESAYSRQLALAQQIASQQNTDKDRELDAENLAYTRAYENAKLIAQLTGDKSLLYQLTGYTPAEKTYSQPKAKNSGREKEVAEGAIKAYEQAILRNQDESAALKAAERYVNDYYNHGFADGTKLSKTEYDRIMAAIRT